ncbi:LOW QUALITY PROTEIN: armadillo repeat-containing protein 7 [Cloeon dipterum]|uniref:LOW QUALITY PROTEIN: armadillo repeat-containing protein 7 n=1 Tax=Cloeon dipterum TaxID=197152 RepID=UPI00322058D5
MFSSKESLATKTGEFGVGRCDYLAQLVREFHETRSQEAKRQILANLANFAYDPINFEFLRLHRVIDLFIDTLPDEDESLAEFAVGGLCNLCVDPQNQEYILQNNGIHRLQDLLQSKNQEIVCSTITTLIYLKTPSSLKDLQAKPLINRLSDLVGCPNKRISNLAHLFLSEVRQNAASCSAAETVVAAPPDSISQRLCSAHQIGDKASFTRTITMEDVENFTLLSGDSNPVHQGPNAVVHGAFLNSLVSCIMGTKVPGPGSMVASQNIKYPNPCHVGEFIEVSVILTGMKMDLIKCRYTVMAKPNKDSTLAESRLVLSGDANLIKIEDQKKRAKKK